MSIMWTLTVILLALAVFLACASLGAGLYEVSVLDPVWPHRPAIVQPQHGGLSRRRFWIPAHSAFEIALVAAVIVTWDQPGVRAALAVAVASHVLMRAWSLIDFIPRALAFERADPATIDTADATRWTRRSMLRLPLDVVTCIASLTALVAAA
jgi:hypothetical protein